MRPGSSPSLASSWPSSVSTNQTSRGALTLGTMMTSIAAPAPVTTSMRSSWHHTVSRPLIRTARVFDPQSSWFRASTIAPRAATLALGATASSRSRNTRSASLAAAFAIILSLEPGVESSERRRRIGRVMSISSACQRAACRSAKAATTVDGQADTGDERGVTGCEVRHGVGDVGRLHSRPSGSPARIASAASAGRRSPKAATMNGVSAATGITALTRMVGASSTARLRVNAATAALDAL